MKRLLVILLILAPALAFAEDNPWAAWPYKLKVRVTHPEVSDFTGMARVRVNLGASAAKDLGDVRILDDKLREQPWRLVSCSSAGDADIVFHAVKGCADYTLIFGVSGKTRPDYGVALRFGRVIVDDSIPRRAHSHGLWEWAVSPTLSGAFSHTSPLLDRVGYHGTSEMANVDIESGDMLQTWVYIDPANPPQEIMMRLAFARRAEEGDWEHKAYYIVYWGKKAIRGLNDTHLLKGELPPAGSWQPLEVNLHDLARRVGGGDTGWLYGINFATDKGRAYWDLTTIGPMPAETDLVALERSNAAAPAFVWQKLPAFRTAGPETVQTEVRFISTEPRASWDFGDGGSAETSSATHVFLGPDARKVTLKPAEGAAVARDVDSFRGSASAVSFAVEPAGCPFIARGDDRALFNLRLEGSPPRTLSAEARAILFDAQGKEVRRESAAVKLYPGDKHPAFQAFSLDPAAGAPAKVKFELLYGGRVLADREVLMRSSGESLDGLKILGDRYVDAKGTPVVVRSEVARVGGGPAAERKVPPARTLVVGRMPFGSVDFAAELKAALGASGVRGDDAVKLLAVDAQPTWSMPSRLLLAVAQENWDAAAPDVVLIAAPWEMMQAGVPVRAACDALGACIDQVRLRSKADVVLVAPAEVAGSEDLARQYAVALRLLGIEKDVAVVDLYSRSVRLASESPDALKSSRIEGGILVRVLDPRLVRQAVEAVAEELVHPSPLVRSGE